MKSLETRLLGLYTALITDVSRYYPRDAIEWKRDETRLRSAVNLRGSKFITLDLVAVGKHFDKCLSTELYIPSHLPFQKARKKGEVVPRLFGGLLRRVFNSDGKLRQDVDLTAVSLLRQLYYAGKKVQHDCDDSATYKTVAEFFDVEMDCRSPDLRWDCDDLGCSIDVRHHLRDAVPDGMPGADAQLRLPLLDLQGRSSLGTYPSRELLDTVQLLADIVSNDIGEVTYDALKPKHGPGAVSDLPRKSLKYSFPNWPLKLELSFPASTFALPNEGFFEEAIEGGVVKLSRHEPPSKLIAVPKTQKGPRLIASEPTAHQWMQQGVRAWLLTRFEDTFLSKSIDFHDQRPSQRAALQASTLGTGCTIDLSSASDRLSLWCVERFFRLNWSLLEALHATRTRWVVNEIDKKSPEFLVLRKFAPMGSALTFPVQSIIYATVCIACMIFRKYGKASSQMGFERLRSIASECASQVVIFGDDLIVPEEDYSLVSEVLTYLGLKVSIDKTFVGGKFYESCGVDAFAGVDVTPTYYLQHPVESDPSSIVSAVETSNNLHRAGLWVAADWLIAEMPFFYRKKLGIDAMEDGAFGLKSFVGRSISHLMEVWNENLQHWEQLRLLLRSKQELEPAEGISSLLQYFTEAPEPEFTWVHGLTRRVQLSLRVGQVHAGALASTGMDCSDGFQPVWTNQRLLGSSAPFHSESSGGLKRRSHGDSELGRSSRRVPIGRNTYIQLVCQRFDRPFVYDGCGHRHSQAGFYTCQGIPVAL